MYRCNARMGEGNSDQAGMPSICKKEFSRRESFPLTWFPLPPARPIGGRAALDRTAVLALTCRLQASSEKPPIESHTSLVFDQPRWHNHHVPFSHCDGDLPPLFGAQPQISQTDKIPRLFPLPILRSQAPHPALCDNARGRMHGMVCSPWLLWLRDPRKSTYRLGGTAWGLARVLQRSTVVVVMTHACLGHDVACG